MPLLYQSMPNIAGYVVVGWARGNLITYLLSGWLHGWEGEVEADQDGFTTTLIL